MLTAEPDLVWCDGKAEDRNYASRTGFRFVRESVGAGRDKRAVWPRLLGDTLMVKVDLTHVELDLTLPDGKRVRNDYLDDVLEVTLWCGLRNARSAWPAVRFVQYELVGESMFQHLAGLYSLEKVAAPEPYESGEQVQLSTHRAHR